MRGKRIAVAVVLATVAAVGGVAPAARAAGPGEAFYADVNGDGYRDRVFLGTVAPGSCSVIVQYGRPLGVLLPPIAYTYLRPGGAQVVCPDIGVAVDLDADGVDNLVVGWSGGPPPTITRNLLVLGHNFIPSFGITTFVSRPRYLGSIDFDGDGRPDVYALSSGNQGLETYYSLGDGTLTIGPVRWCADVVEPVFKDFNKDGASGALLAYTGECTDHSSGVVEVKNDGTPYQLQFDPAGVRVWQAKVAYVNGDSWADVRTLALDTGEVDYFIQRPGGSGEFVKSPTATHDRITVSGDRAVAIDVLANDYATTTARVTIVEPPRYGTVQVTSARTIVYRPSPAHRASDRFVYRLTEGPDTSSAAVNIRFTG